MVTKVKEDIVSMISPTLLRFYNEIIAGVWAILIVIPFDSYLYTTITGRPSYNITSYYWIFFVVYTGFFLLSASLIPFLKEWQVNKEIDALERSHKITAAQKKKIEGVLRDVLVYKRITTREGFMQFTMMNVFCIGVILAYFGIEGLMAAFMNDGNAIISLIFIVLFLITLIIESFLDDYMVQKMRKHTSSSNVYGIHGASKNLLTLILRNLGGGGSISENISQLIVEDAIEDISEIMHISSSVDGTGKVVRRVKNRTRGRAFSRALMLAKKSKRSSGKKSSRNRYVARRSSVSRSRSSSRSNNS